MKITAALRNPHFWPWLIILPGAILRLWHLGGCSPLWYDEAYTAILVRLPLGQMITSTAGDVHPPLYYILLWFWKFAAGTDPLGLRLMSVLFSIWTLIDFNRLTEELNLSRRAGLIALAIMAFLPLNIYYAQEARMYALLQWLVIMQLRSVLQRDWVKLGIFTTFALYTHNYALFYTAIIALVGMGRELIRERPVYRPHLDGELSGTGFIPMCLSLLTAGVLWLPWSAVLLRQMHIIQGNFWIPPVSLGSVLNALNMLLNIIMPDSLIPLTAFCLWASILLLCFSALRKPRHVSLLLLAVGPVIMAVIVSLLWQPVILYRGLIGIAAPLAALAGDALSRSTRRGLAVGTALLLPFAISLVWLIGAGEVGMAKKTLSYPTFRDDLPIIHLDMATLIQSQSINDNFLLDAGCPDIAGGLSPMTMQGMGVREINIDNLPDEFIFVEQLFPNSTACHEKTFYQLSRGAEKLIEQKNPLAQMGVWHVTKNR